MKSQEFKKIEQNLSRPARSHGLCKTLSQTFDGYSTIVSLVLDFSDNLSWSLWSERWWSCSTREVLAAGMSQDLFCASCGGLGKNFVWALLHKFGLYSPSETIG